MNLNLLRGAAIAAATTFASHASADVITLGTSGDNTLYFSSTGALSNGTGPKMSVGVNDNGEARRAVLRFDVASAIPSGSTINSAYVVLRITSSASFTIEPHTMHRLTSDWGEGSSNAEPFGSGDGAPSAVGDATWIHAFSPSSNWASAGGDFVASPSASSQVGGFGAPAFFDAGMGADVQAWVDGTVPDFGWLLKSDESGISTARRYATREGAPQDAPELVINFTPPPTQIGTTFCNTGPNSTGSPAGLSAFGSELVADQNVTLAATDLPPNQFGIFIVSQTMAPIQPGLNLCLGGTVGRFNGPGQALSSGAAGTFSLTIDLNRIPQGSFFDAVAPGDVWNFQAWFRDVGQGGSNLTDGLAISFS